MPDERDPAPEGAPLHGYRGVATPPPAPERPQAVSVAISREAGARGHSIARAVGRRLGWPVYRQDALDSLAHDPEARGELLRGLPEAAVHWADLGAAELLRRRGLAADHPAAELARLIFALAAGGRAVLVGRGAGFVLPRATTVHVRVVAPFDGRAAYLAQWLRLTGAGGAEEAIRRDARRSEFVAHLTETAVHDPTAYDAILNSARLPDETVAGLIVALVRARSGPDAPPESDGPA